MMARVKVFFSFLLIFIVTDSTFAVIWPCQNNDDCTAENSICSSISGLCECNDFESVFSGDYTKCLKTSLFGDQCEDTVQCNLMPSGANCKSGVCDCIDGHTYVRGRCRPLNGLEQPCETDLDCYFGYDRTSVTCQNQFCACADGYYRRNGNICRRKSMEIDDACIVDEDCDELGTTVKCISFKCQHDNENNKNVKEATTTTTTKIDTNGNRELPKLKTETSTTSETTSQLSKSSKSSKSFEEEESPIDSLSSPKQEQHQQEHQQQQLPNKKEDVEKTPLKVEVEVQTNIAGAIDAADELVNGSKNLLELDTESVNVNLERTQRLREIAVQTSLETFELKPLSSVVSVGSQQVRNVGTATASTSTSSRRASYYRRRRASIYNNRRDEEDKTFSTLSNTDDDVDENKYGSSCTENGKPCSGLAHSVCSNSICFCRQGYYHKGGKCFAELGEIAESAAECEHTFDELSKKCICQKNYFYERNLRSCRKPIQYHLSCTSNSQCSPFGAAYCHPEIPRRCTCEEYAEYDALRQLCIYKQGLGAQCESNDGCPVEHSICSNSYCVCKDNFVQKGDICVAGIGAECKLDEECLVDNSMCADTVRLTKSIDIEDDLNDEEEDEDDKDKTCQCRKGFVHFKDECLKEATEIDDECIDSEQCKPLLGTCIDKKCSCTPEQHFKYGRCEDKKGLGEACSKAGECFIEKGPENVECRNSICQCKFGYQADVEQRACIRVMPSKKNSSGRPSALKIVTFLLIGSAFLITSAAIKQAYY